MNLTHLSDEFVAVPARQRGVRVMCFSIQGASKSFQVNIVIIVQTELKKAPLVSVHVTKGTTFHALGLTNLEKNIGEHKFTSI